jgi:hypothetical protein
MRDLPSHMLRAPVETPPAPAPDGRFIDPFFRDAGFVAGVPDAGLADER